MGTSAPLEPLDERLPAPEKPRRSPGEAQAAVAKLAAQLALWQSMDSGARAWGMRGLLRVLAFKWLQQRALAGQWEGWVAAAQLNPNP